MKAYELFIQTFEAKYPKAVECLTKDKEYLFAFYDFPSVHWIHLRTTNPIEATFSTVRLRHRRTKGNGTRQATLTMVFRTSRSIGTVRSERTICEPYREKTYKIIDASSYQSPVSYVIHNKKLSYSFAVYPKAEWRNEAHEV